LNRISEFGSPAVSVWAAAQPATISAQTVATTHDHKEVTMKTQISKQHTNVVAIQPLTTFHKEDRMKNHSTTLLKLFAICAMISTLTLTAFAGPTCDPAPTTTMVAWYPFDELCCGAQNLATQNGGTWHGGLVSGWPGYIGYSSLYFDGSTAYVESPSSIATNFGPANASPCGGVYSTCQGNFSIAVWIRASTSQFGTIVDKRTLGTLPNVHGYLLMQWGNGLLLQLADGAGSSGYYNYTVSPPPGINLTDGNWHFVGVSVTRASTTGLAFYIDNWQSPFQNPTGRMGSLVNNSPLRIGASTGSSPTNFFSGYMDELQMWNRALTGPEMYGIWYAKSLGVCKQ
jgi:hypothetical protein